MRTVSFSRCYKHYAATNWNDLRYRMTLETLALLAFLNVNLKVIFLALPILPSHVSPQRLQVTILLHMALCKFFILYCILYCI